MSTKSYISRACVLVTAAGAAVLLGSGVASAHVSAKVLGEPAAQGGFTKITFRVPNEEPTAGTIKFEVSIPAKYALSSVTTKPMPGWTAKVVKTKLNPPVRSGGTKVDEAITGVSWSAAKGTRIGPDQFQEFEISAGLLPDNTNQLVLPAKQTYDNGKAVDWNDPPVTEGAAEPDHPAPVVALSPKASGPADADGDGPDEVAATNQGQSSATAAPATAADDDARWLGGAGLAVGALGLGFGVGATLLARRPVATTKDKA